MKVEELMHTMFCMKVHFTRSEIILKSWCCACLLIIGMFSTATYANSAVELQIKSLGTYLSIPDDYFIQWHDANRVTIHVDYPRMQPTRSKVNFSMDKAIRIYIAVEGLSGTDEVKSFLRHVYGSSCIPKVDCYARKISVNQQYKLYREGSEGDYVNKAGKAANYYLFKSYDKQDILLEDSGKWSESYRVKRNIDGFILLDYQFPKKIVENTEMTKEISQDFIVIDKAVTEFVKKYLKYKANKMPINLSQP